MECGRYNLVSMDPGPPEQEIVGVDDVTRHF